MTSYVTPRKNVAHKFYIGLTDQSNTKLLKANPTIASGDFKVSIDGGAFANLATLPSANPASGRAIMIDLSSTEMNGDNIVVQCVDAAGAEWCDKLIAIQTTARQIDDLAFPVTSGRGMVVDAAGLVDANTVKVGPTGSGTAQTARDVGASVLLSSGTGTGQLDFTSGVVKANATQWLGGTIPAVNVTGVPLVDLKYTLGTISPATAGSVRADAVTGAVGSVTGAVGSVTGLTASDVGAIKTKTDFLPSATAGAAGGVFIAGSNAATSITAALTANVIGNVTGNLSGSVGSVTGAVGSVTGAVGSVTGSVGSIATGGIAAASFAAGAIDAAAIAANAIDASALATDAVDEIVDAVWDELLSGHAVSGSTGEALSAAGAAGDPWITALPGSYSAGQAGKIVGDFLNASVSSRATQTSVDDLPTNAELATALGTADDAVLAAVATAQTAIDAIPTNAELATALGTADDAVLAAIAGLTTPPTTAAIADKILGRNLAGGSDGGRMVKDALRPLRNKTSISAGTMTVCEEDDTTPAWTAAVTTTPGDPLSAIDPA